MGTPPELDTLLVYTVDGDDRIDAISPCWDALAVDNGAGTLTRDAVVGRSIWRFIDGLETVEIFRLLFAGVRERGLDVTLPFRCDGPGMRRFMEMTVRPSGQRGVEIRCKQEREEPRPAVALLDPRAARSDGMLKVCSWCKKVALPRRGWVEVEEAVHALGLLDRSPLPGISHGMCEPCLDVFRGAIERGRPGDR